jgi:hypothetical protein
LKNKVHIFLVSLIYCSIFLCCQLANAQVKPISKGSLLPDLSFQESISKDVWTYLGISQKKNLFLRDIQAPLFIIEVFSTYCMSCPKNVPVFNSIYSSIENDAQLKGKVKVISIAIGNTQNEVKDYQKTYKTLYPIVTDYHFKAHKAFGNPRVPYTIFVKRDSKGKNKVIETHQGVFESADTIIDSIRGMLRK